MSGRSCGVGCVRIGAFPKRNSRSTWGSSSLYTTCESAVKRYWARSLSYSFQKTPDPNKSVVDYGFSFGGAMTNLIACVRQRSTRAVAVDAGWLPDAGCDGPVSYWAEHADDDQAVSITAGRAAKEFWRNMDSCSTATTPVWPSPCVAYTGCQSGFAVTWCELPQGGHTWNTWTSQAIAAFLSQY